MRALKEMSGVWFVYDGDCPICTYAAEALRIKQKFGSLSLLNARETADAPLIDEINKQGYDLDEGMVIYASDEFYHGKDALNFMARYGEASNLFMYASKGLFWSDTLSRLIYPWMRETRNWLIRRKNVSQIDNLNLKAEPIFKSIFGEDWDNLPPIMKKHYGSRPYSTEVTTVEGVLDVSCKKPLLWFSPLMKLLGQIPAFNKKNVPVTVQFQSDVNSKAFHFNRSFKFPERKPYVFHSRMLQVKANEIIEIMRFGLAWRMAYSWDGEKVILAHKGYALHVFGHMVPLPLTLLIGAGSAEEWPVDENTFDMKVRITHPLWGEVYGYKGRFEVST